MPHTLDSKTPLNPGSGEHLGTPQLDAVPGEGSPFADMTEFSSRKLLTAAEYRLFEWTLRVLISRSKTDVVGVLCKRH